MEAYLDNSATTQCFEEVRDIVVKTMMEDYGNPSAMHKKGVEAEQYVKDATEKIAKTLKVQEKEIYFTSGGTESDNWAIKAAAQMLKEKGRHIITSKIEHHAILNSCAYLEKQGFEVTYLDVDEWGSIRLDVLEKAIRKDTILISVMYANNEVGTIQKIAQIGKIAEKNDILFHTDAVQAYGQLLIDVKKENIDLLSASAHKFNGPKGVGFLYIRKKIPLPEYIHGGKQERNHRAGRRTAEGSPFGYRKCSGNRWNGKSSRNCIYHKGVPGERNTAIKRLFNTEITERNTILPLKWKSYKQTAR